jgi:YVTN family beta-propeller protein
MKRTTPGLFLFVCALALAGAAWAADPVVTGQWDFDHGDLRATVGADLEFIGDTATITTFPKLNIDGRASGVMAFGSNSIHQGFYMRHGARPNGGGHFVNQYTLLMDVMFPAQSSGQWRALLQTDPFNHEGTDAEFFVGANTTVPDPGGIGAESQFNGPLAPDTWYRIAFAVDLTAAPGQQLIKYVNGLKVGSQSLSGGVDGRSALGPTALLFTAGDSFGGRTAPGYVHSIQFVNGWMPPQAIAALGGPNADGLPAGNAVIRFTNISLSASLLSLSWAGPPGQFQVERATRHVNPDWQPVSDSTTNHSVSVPLDTPAAWYRLRQFRPDIKVGPQPVAEQAIPSRQILRAAGQQVQFAGRPVDLAFSPIRNAVYLKNMNNLVVVDTGSWTVTQTLSYPGSGASMHGITVSRDGSHVYVTGAGNELYEGLVATNGVVRFARTIALPAGSDPCGLALAATGTQAYVCLSIKNQLAVVNLATGVVSRTINVGIAPWDIVLSADGNTAYVSDWGGRTPGSSDLVALSAGSQVVVDSRGVAASGVVSFVDLTAGLETAEVATGLHPSDLELSPDGGSLYVANANSDTVTVIDTQARAVKETILIRPDPSFAYGSAADGLALSKDGQKLFVAMGGNNAIGVVELPNGQHTNSLLQGFLPTGWYPGAVLVDTNFIYVANVKGLGTRFSLVMTNQSWQVEAHLGTANKIPIPTADSLSKYTAQVFEDGRIPQIKQTQQPAHDGQVPVSVPARVGEPSVFQHVLYILKENKTYDQMFGDIPQGNGAPSLCIYPRLVSPNHHALAEQYVLLDNFYCQGVNSADGHSWSTEANNTDHLEKSFGGFSRSYTFGDDPLTYSSTGFIWNNALQHGLTFRNYGEMDYAEPSPAASWLKIYSDFTNHTHSIHYVQNIGVAALRPYSSTNVPGWNLEIPDVVRADGFIRELNAAQSNGVWAALHLLYLPNDHTGGSPTPQAQVADNDLALGQVVEAVTRSTFATNTVIFVIEDDPQSGYDHVDGHRSLCLVISPYTKRRQVVSTFYNQAGVLHTMEQILGLPPMNQQDAMAPLMFDCFTNTPDFTAYAALTNNVPLAQGTGAAGQVSPKERYWAKKLRKMDFSKPDRIDEDVFNRYIWFTIKGNASYPAKFVGGHGRGLKQLGLFLKRDRQGDADDDEQPVHNRRP